MNRSDLGGARSIDIEVGRRLRVEDLISTLSVPGLAVGIATPRKLTPSLMVRREAGEWELSSTVRAAAICTA